MHFPRFGNKWLSSNCSIHAIEFEESTSFSVTQLFKSMLALNSDLRLVLVSHVQHSLRSHLKSIKASPSLRARYLKLNSLGLLINRPMLTLFYQIISHLLSILNFLF